VDGAETLRSLIFPVHRHVLHGKGELAQMGFIASNLRIPHVSLRHLEMMLRKGVPIALRRWLASITMF